MHVELKMIGADWCGPCKRMWPWRQEITQQLGDVTCSYVSIEDYRRDDLVFVPTLIVLRDGVEVGRITRFSGKRALVREVQGMLEAPQ
jgi:thioredoxin